MSFLLQLIRHGATQANENSLYCGYTDLPLTQNGRDGIAGLLGLLPYEKTQAYFTSSLKRANETLAIIFGEVEYLQMPDLREFNFGEFEMHSHDELMARDDYRAWIADQTGTLACTGGESVATFNERVSRGFDELVRQARSKGISSATLVAHGGTISRICTSLAGGEHNMYDFMPTHGEGYLLTISDGDPPQLVGIEKLARAF